MTIMKIPLYNLIRHKWASLILIIIFALTTFVFYWAFGYTNLMTNILNQSYSDSYGEFVFFTSNFEKKKAEELLKNQPFKKLLIEREIRGILDNPQKSDMVVLSELTKDTRERLKRYIRPTSGRLPEKTDEIAVSEFLKEGVYKVGDQVYITTTTPNKIINTKRYQVVGITKSSGWKGYGSSFLISESSMTDLLASDTHANLIYVDLDKNIYNTRDKIKTKFLEVKTILEKNGIDVKDSWMTFQQLDKLATFAILFASIKSLLMIIFFPLIGAVVAALVWMHAFRRRKEIWTYSSLGMPSGKIIILMASEYLILTTIGILIGLAGGALTAFMTEKANIWFRFSYTFVSPLLVEMTLSDLLTIIIFLFVCVGVWMLPPLRRIINSPLFRY